MPSTPFIGVRISWLMLARNSSFDRVIASAARSRISSSRVRSMICCPDSRRTLRKSRSYSASRSASASKLDASWLSSLRRRKADPCSAPGPQVPTRVALASCARGSTTCRLSELAPRNASSIPIASAMGSWVTSRRTALQTALVIQHGDHRRRQVRTQLHGKLERDRLQRQQPHDAMVQAGVHDRDRRAVPGLPRRLVAADVLSQDLTRRHDQRHGHKTRMPGRLAQQVRTATLIVGCSDRRRQRARKSGRIVARIPGGPQHRHKLRGEQRHGDGQHDHQPELVSERQGVEQLAERTPRDSGGRGRVALDASGGGRALARRIGRPGGLLGCCRHALYPRFQRGIDPGQLPGRSPPNIISCRSGDFCELDQTKGGNAANAGAGPLYGRPRSMERGVNPGLGGQVSMTNRRNVILAGRTARPGATWYGWACRRRAHRRDTTRFCAGCCRGPAR